MSWHDGILYVATLIFKSPFRNLWPLALAPAAALLISNRAARLVPRTPPGSTLGAMLAALPGMVGFVVICQAMEFGKVVAWRGVVAHWLTPLVAIALLTFVLVRAARRHALVGRLFALAMPASGRLAGAASGLGLRALEIPSETRDCFVAGILRPTVFVSSGALRSLDDAELSAALHHERVHIRSRDTLSLALLAILRDLAPWGRGEALNVFRAARESAADQAAARAAGSLNLAGALLALARPGRLDDADAAVLSMAGGEGLRQRMTALLDGDERAPARPSTRARLALGAGLIMGAALLWWPLFQWQIMELCCPH